jgi:L-fuculose-phosphate aldolase
VQLVKDEIVSIGKRMYERGYVASNDGNISVRVSPDEILITPTGVSKGFMKPGQMVRVTLDGTVLSRLLKPSSEVGMHLYIYNHRPDVHSICHAHTPYATAFAASGKELNSCLLPEMIYTLGKVPLVAYGTPGTEELYSGLSGYLKDYDAFLLANHGVVTVGASLTEAYHKMETVEHTAKISFLTEEIGSPKTLSPEQVQKIIEQKRSQGIKTKTDCQTCSEGAECTSAVGSDLIDEIVKQVLFKISGG